MSDEPTLGEVVRRLDHIASQLAELMVAQGRQQNYVEENFVRQSVWDERQNVWMEGRRADQAMTANLHQDIGELKRERVDDVRWRRQATLALAVVAISSLVSIAIAIVNLR